MERSTTLTYDDLLALPDDNLCHELIDGVHFMTAAPNLRHQLVSGRLYVAFFKYFEENGGGMVFQAPVDVLFSQRDVVEPDLLVILDHQREIMTEKNIQGAPALVVEIVSNSRYDRVHKRALYERVGVPEYWIVDPDTDRVEILRLAEGVFGRPKILEAGDSLTFAPLPNLEISVAGLLAL